MNQLELRARYNKPPKERENVGEQVVIGVSFASNWLGEWYEFSRPITERSQPIRMQFPIAFDG